MRQESSTYIIPEAEMGPLGKKLDGAGYRCGTSGETYVVAEGRNIVARANRADPGEREGFVLRLDNFPHSKRLDGLMKNWCRESERSGQEQS